MDAFERDPFEGKPLPNIGTPAREGWKVSSIVQDGGLLLAEREDGTEGFVLTNRSFEQTDYYLSYKLLATLIKKIKENPGRKITVLDIGGGVLSECMRGMLKHPFLKGKIQCINIDPFAKAMVPEELEAEGISPRDLLVVPDDFLTCFVTEEAMDVIFSYQVLDHMSDEKVSVFLKKAAAALAPGGEAWINESARLNGYSDPFRPWMIMPRFNQPQEADWLQSNSR